MNVIIENCFDWIGFHLIEKYLNEGFEVCGIDQLDERKEFLYEMIGRNASFHFYDDVESIDDDEMREAMFISIVKNKEHIREVNTNLERYIILNEIEQVDTNQLESKNNYYICTPNLFGPWMNKKSYDQYSKEDAFELYIDDFISWLYYFTKSTVKQNVITLQTKKNQKKAQSGCHLMTVLPTTSLDEERIRVKDHIKKYPSYYLDK
jgi:hypothetical protein